MGDRSNAMIAMLRPARTALKMNTAATRYPTKAGARRRKPVAEALQAMSSRTPASIRNLVAPTASPFDAADYTRLARGPERRVPVETGQ
jgi:hypothetical protein